MDSSIAGDGDCFVLLIIDLLEASLAKVYFHIATTDFVTMILFQLLGVLGISSCSLLFYNAHQSDHSIC